MADDALRDRRILVVEDEYLLADDLATGLDAAGAFVLGPVSTLERAMDLIARELDIDGALLDVNLGGQMVYAAADVLTQRGTPFVLTTGYDASVIPSRFAHVARCEKPLDMAEVLRTLASVMDKGL